MYVYARTLVRGIRVNHAAVCAHTYVQVEATFDLAVLYPYVERVSFPSPEAIRNVTQKDSARHARKKFT